MDQVDVGGVRLGFERRGEGPPLVLLHGWRSKSREWRRRIDSPSDEFTVVAWDAPGPGRSSGPPETFRLSDCADCVAAFVAALGLDRAHVAGVSWGGSLAVELYRQHRTVPDTLIVVSACAGWAGSLPAEVVEHWLRLYLRNLELPPDGWTPAVIQTLLTDGATESMVDELTSILSEFHPAAMAVAIRPWLKPTSATCCRASTFQRLCSTAAGPRSQRVLIRRSVRHVMAEMRPSLWRGQ
jgi:pimeloyl-ACP methyl ester carboxylesterase